MVVHTLMRPMAVISGRLRTGMRLLLLTVVLIVPGLVAATMYTVNRNVEIAFASNEISGARAVRPLLDALADTVAGATPDLDAVRRVLAAEPALSGIRQPDLGDGGPAARAALASALTDLIGRIGNASNLVLDPQLDSFYVMDAQLVQLPKALVAAARAADRPDAEARAVLGGELRDAADGIASDLRTADAGTKASGLAARVSVAGRAPAVISAFGSGLSRTTTPDPAAVGQAAHAAIPGLNDELASLLRTRERTYTRQRTLVLTIATGGLLVGGWFAAAVVTGTSRDVRQTVLAVRAIAEGNLSAQQLPNGRDEWGEIGRSLDAARNRLQEQDDTIRAGTVAREQQMRSNFLNQRQAETQFRQRTQAVVDESTGVIAGALRDITDQVGQVRNAASTINHSITVSDQATASVLGQARQAEHAIAGLGRSLDRVAETVALINGIARQTRLLALNATIEAARAGTFGPGFTVVADEVKELANSTARSTEKISNTIGELERETAAMSKSISTMVEGMGAVGKAADSLRAVVSDQDSLVHDLSEQMNETLGRVEGMSTLAAQLERRQHDRIAAAALVHLVPAGRPAQPVPLMNISYGGLRCRIPAGLGLAIGDTVRAKIEHGGDCLEVYATVANTADIENSAEVETGLQFLVDDSGEAERLTAFVKRLLEAV